MRSRKETSYPSAKDKHETVSISKAVSIIYTFNARDLSIPPLVCRISQGGAVPPAILIPPPVPKTYSL